MKELTWSEYILKTSRIFKFAKRGLLEASAIIRVLNKIFIERFSNDLEKWFQQVLVICFISQWMKRSKHGLFVFPPKKTLINRRNCSIGQSCCSMTSKRSIVWFLESSRAWRFFTRAFAQPTKSHTRVCVWFDKQIKSLYFCSFVVFVLFAHFHFKVIRKSLYHVNQIQCCFFFYSFNP